ncbi:hypothetical protein D9757_000994 [Collybiopsis confluens]|uniref:Glycosyl transferase family 3 domain-containing protein n=1 Tax=Collybiopsis confluens TaxID=2823264 RepID=A0A8H5MG77_9AGAR|nr:hypothetical protein D9757_000994 [Collybiopsis confluens]
MVVGVPRPELGLAFAQALHQSGVACALVVCGQEGIDEISCAGPTWIWELRDERITTGVISPKDFGLDTHPLEDVKGGNAGENAETLRALLTDYEGEDGLGLGPVQRKAVLDFVLMNASALLVTAGVVDSYIEGVRLARVSVISGKAWSALETFRKECGRTGILH